MKRAIFRTRSYEVFHKATNKDVHCKVDDIHFVQRGLFNFFPNGFVSRVFEGPFTRLIASRLRVGQFYGGSIRTYVYGLLLYVCRNVYDRNGSQRILML